MSHPEDATEARAGTILRLVGRMIGGPKKGRAALAVVALLISLVGLIVIPSATGRGMNVIAQGGSKSDLSVWAIVGLTAGAVYLLFSFVANQLFARLASEALYELQTDLFDNVQTLSMGFFFKNSPGELSSNVTNDAEVISLFYTTALSQILRSTIQVILLVAVMFAVNWQLALVAILTIPLLAGVAYAIAQVSGPAFNRLQETLGDVSAYQEETLSGHKVIISNNRRQWASERHEEHVAGVYKVGRRAFMSALMQFPITQTLSLVQNVLVLVAGTFLVIDGSTTLGTVIAFAGYSALLASPLAEMANLITTSLNASAAGDRVFRIIDERPEIQDAPDAVDYEFKGGRIQFEHVDFGYVPHSLVLRDNTFDVEPGESIGICGPTGAGKSTLINILTRYYDITAGRILIDGQDLSKLTQASLRKQIGVVLQEAFLFTDTVMNNLLYANEDATPDDAIEAAKKANAHDFILGLPDGYDTMLTERGANLSQGQRQMITIARAMVADPKMMILDEATSNVDTRTEKLIQDGMRKLMDDKTSFSIAHRLATIRGSSRIMVLNGGVIEEMAGHDELMAAKGFYHALYMSQFKGKGPAGDPGDIALEFVST
ncbi:MAG: ABC transporter ATP-binding protein/permease [Acidimicrobiia bacterium]|nr:ABC transporter ATP-binding protein/permease [Acidimicrobiia bacterium]MDH4308094.1 ABC transporter ATP-binding protein/permease [Acidimicrobiia bacterium]MDH5293040.1 ABC transporter ATP-binding protein/permease [Acidimicrobiia bacterium]